MSRLSLRGRVGGIYEIQEVAVSYSSSFYRRKGLQMC